ncbi:MAG: hypothetical protein J6V22_01615 [Clostridia bacterium]|nr:hypothetical protein [Clostridia bacterium]
MRKFFVVLSTLLFVICICSACGKTVVVDENCEQRHAAIVGKWSYLTKDEALRQVIFNEDGTCSLNNKKDEWSTACYDDVHNVRIRSTREFIRFDETKLYYDGDEYLNGKRYRYVRVDYDNWSEFFSSNFYDTFELNYEFGDYQTNDKDGNMIFYKGISFYAKPKDLDKVKLIPGIAVEFVFAEEGMPSTIKLDWDAREILSIEHSGDIKDVSNVKNQDT